MMVPSNNGSSVIEIHILVATMNSLLLATINLIVFLSPLQMLGDN